MKPIESISGFSQHMCLNAAFLRLHCEELLICTKNLYQLRPVVQLGVKVNYELEVHTGIVHRFHELWYI